MTRACNSYAQQPGRALVQRRRTIWEDHCSQPQPGVMEAQQGSSWFIFAKVHSPWGLIPTASLKPKPRKNDQFEIRWGVKKSSTYLTYFSQIVFKHEDIDASKIPFLKPHSFNRSHRMRRRDSVILHTWSNLHQARRVPQETVLRDSLLKHRSPPASPRSKGAAIYC